MVSKGTPMSLTQSSTVFALLESVARKDGALKGKTYWGLFSYRVQLAKSRHRTARSAPALLKSIEHHLKHMACKK